MMVVQTANTKILMISNSSLAMSELMLFRQRFKEKGLIPKRVDDRKEVVVDDSSKCQIEIKKRFTHIERDVFFNPLYSGV